MELFKVFGTVAIEGNQAIKELGGITKKAANTEKQMSQNFENIGKAAQRSKQVILAVGVAVVGLGAKSIQLASDFEETNAKFVTAFQGVEEQANETAKSLAKGYNMSRLEAEKLLSNTGDLLKGFGFTAKEALNTSDKVQKLAADLASYNNIQGGTTRASEIVTKAMLGERDALTSLGIKISEIDVQQALLEKGQSELTGSALLAAKAQVTLELAMKQSGGAMGDVERTSGSFANQMRRLKGNITDVSVEIGKALLPFYYLLLLRQLPL